MSGCFQDGCLALSWQKNYQVDLAAGLKIEVCGVVSSENQFKDAEGVME